MVFIHGFMCIVKSITYMLSVLMSKTMCDFTKHLCDFAKGQRPSWIPFDHPCRHLCETNQPTPGYSCLTTICLRTQVCTYLWIVLCCIVLCIVLVVEEVNQALGSPFWHFICERGGHQVTP